MSSEAVSSITQPTNGSNNELLTATPVSKLRLKLRVTVAKPVNQPVKSANSEACSLSVPVKPATSSEKGASDGLSHSHDDRAPSQHVDTSCSATSVISFNNDSSAQMVTHDVPNDQSLSDIDQSTSQSQCPETPSDVSVRQSVNNSMILDDSDDDYFPLAQPDPVNYSANQYYERAISHFDDTESSRDSSDQSNNQLVNESIDPDQSNNNSTSQSNNQPVNQSSNQSIDQFDPNEDLFAFTQNSEDDEDLYPIDDFDESIDESTIQSVNQAFDQSTGDSLDESVSQSIHYISIDDEWADLPTLEASTYSTDVPDNASVDRSINQFANTISNAPSAITKHPVNQSDNQSSNQSNNQSNNQSADFDVVDLTDDFDEDETLMPAIKRSVSQTVSSLSGQSNSQPIKRNITDFFSVVSTPIKQSNNQSINQSARSAQLSTKQSNLSSAKTPDKRSSSKSNNQSTSLPVKSEVEEKASTNWQFLLTGNKANNKSNNQSNKQTKRSQSVKGEPVDLAIDPMPDLTSNQPATRRSSKSKQPAKQPTKQAAKQPVKQPAKQTGKRSRAPNFSSFDFESGQGTDAYGKPVSYQSIKQSINQTVPSSIKPESLKSESKSNSSDDQSALERELEQIHRFSLRSGFRSGECPAFKRIPNTNFIVDGFQWSLSPTIETNVHNYSVNQSSNQSTSQSNDHLNGQPVKHESSSQSNSEPINQAKHTFFLSHHHSDHTIGLYKNWSCGTIVCSSITKSLLINEDSLNPTLIRSVEFNQRTLIDGLFVTLIDANHCPGACMFVFELPPFANEAELFDQSNNQSDNQSSNQSNNQTRPRLTNHGPVYLHCGDCRYCESMKHVFIPPVAQSNDQSKNQSNNQSSNQSSNQSNKQSNDQLITQPSNLPSVYTPYRSDYRNPSLTHLSRLTFTGVYLDTTYCIPRRSFGQSTNQSTNQSNDQYNFPSQAEVVGHVLHVVREVLEKEKKTNEKIMSESDDQSIKPVTRFLDGYHRMTEKRTLFLVGSYTIGKEKIWLEIARMFGMKVYASSAKLKLIKQLELFDDVTEKLVHPDEQGLLLMDQATNRPIKQSNNQSNNESKSQSWRHFTAEEVLTGDIKQSRLHVVPLSFCSFERITQYLDPLTNPLMANIVENFHSVVVFRPTGWVGKVAKAAHRVIPVSVINQSTKQSTSKRKLNVNEKTKVYPKINLNVSIHAVPYSEHSSSAELRELVKTMRDCGVNLDEIVPTVDVPRSDEMRMEYRDLFK